MTLVADQFKFVSSNDRYYSLVVHDPLLFSGYFVYLSLLYLLKVFYLPLIREIKVNLLDILFSRRVFRCRMVLKNKVDREDNSWLKNQLKDTRKTGMCHFNIYFL